MLRRVLPVGPKTAKLAIIGEAPGAEEEAKGEPFIGKAGSLLDACLAVAKISRYDCYITNVSKVRPPDNKFDRLGELGITVEQLHSELRDELSTVEANCFVCLGNVALEAMTGKKGIHYWRGSILPSTLLPGRKLVPTIHPANALRGQIETTFFIQADLVKAKRESEFSDFRSLPQRRYILNPSYQQVIACLEDIEKNWTYVTLDIENVPQTDIITEIGLGDHAYGEDGHYVITIPFYKAGAVWPPEQEKEIWRRVRKICINPRINKIAQNATHEKTVLYRWIGEIYPFFTDTMISHHLCYAEQPKDLGVIGSLYTNEPAWKNEKDAEAYNATDVAVTHEAAFVLENDELPATGLNDFLHGYEMPLFNILWQASQRGIKVDEEKRQAYYDAAEVELSKLQTALNAVVGFELNVDSPKQVQKYLYNTLGLPPQRKKGKITADEEAILKLFNKYPDLPALKLILEVRGQGKAMSSYLSKSCVDEDGRFRPSWVITGAETGRLSSRKNTWGTGANAQNIPKHVRDMYMADEGCSFVVGDLSQVEARFVAWLSGDPTYKAMFNSGKDIHKQVAGWIFKKDAESVMPSERQRAKASAHGAPYGMTHKKVAALYNLPEDEAKWLMEQYFNMFPMVRSAYQAGIREELRHTRMLKTPFGRRRIFFGYWGEDMFREAYANVPQGSAVDTINMAAVRIHHRVLALLQKHGMKPFVDACILLQVHDELVIQCRDEIVNDVARIFKEEVERPIIVNGDPIIIPVELNTGKRWHKDYLKEWKEEELMRGAELS